MHCAHTWLMTDVQARPVRVVVECPTCAALVGASLVAQGRRVVLRVDVVRQGCAAVQLPHVRDLAAWLSEVTGRVIEVELQQPLLAPAPAVPVRPMQTRHQRAATKAAPAWWW